jgi:hypothetical protein
MLSHTWLAKENGAPVFCYSCGEEILHNPAMTMADLALFAGLVRARGIDALPDGDREAALVLLFHEVIATGLRTLSSRPIQR